MKAFKIKLFIVAALASSSAATLFCSQEKAKETKVAGEIKLLKKEELSDSFQQILTSLEKSKTPQKKALALLNIPRIFSASDIFSFLELATPYIDFSDTAQITQLTKLLPAFLQSELNNYYIYEWIKRLIDKGFDPSKLITTKDSESILEQVFKAYYTQKDKISAYYTLEIAKLLFDKEAINPNKIISFWDEKADKFTDLSLLNVILKYTNEYPDRCSSEIINLLLDNNAIVTKEMIEFQEKQQDKGDCHKKVYELLKTHGPTTERKKAVEEKLKEQTRQDEVISIITKLSGMSEASDKEKEKTGESKKPQAGKEK